MPFTTPSISRQFCHSRLRRPGPPWELVGAITIIELPARSFSSSGSGDSIAARRRISPGSGQQQKPAALPRFKDRCGPTPSARCAPRPSAAPRRCRPRIRSSSRCRTPARPNGIARTPPGSSSNFCSCRMLSGYRAFDERFAYLFNSYYVAAGPRHARPERGLITRPNAQEVTAYRAHVDRAVSVLIEGADEALLEKIIPVVEIGLNHEQQHQELIWTDILHAFAQNPTSPAYDKSWQPPARRAGAGEFVDLKARHLSGRSRRRRLLLRQRAAGASGAAARRRDRAAPRHQRRMARSSSPTAATRRRRSGCRTAGRWSRRKAGARRAIGARSTAPGIR